MQDTEESTETLVSIGVPTFNRPELLERALEHLINQSYRNIEILVSDNASTDPGMQEVIQRFAAKDGRIDATLQPTALSPYKNFIYVLEKSRGKFFMWAADDDYIEPWFVERCLDKFEVVPNCALVCAEAQYFWKDTKFDFIPEGNGFRAPLNEDATGRVENLLHNNYGNLIYGLFRRSALVDNEGVQWARTLLSSPNEIAPLLLAANAGEIVTLPDIGLYKQAPRQVYEQVVWENTGGSLPTGPTLSPRGIVGTFGYHWDALKDIYSAIEITGLPDASKRHLRQLTRRRLTKHFFQLVVGRKARVVAH